MRKPPTIQVERLEKRFGDLEAVRGVDFEVRTGETFGFLGPNGAGKSTTINMLCTLLKPTAGRAAVAGFDVVTERDEIRREIGVVFQDMSPRHVPFRCPEPPVPRSALRRAGRRAQPPHAPGA